MLMGSLAGQIRHRVCLTAKPVDSRR